MNEEILNLARELKYTLTEKINKIENEENKKQANDALFTCLSLLKDERKEKEIIEKLDNDILQFVSTVHLRSSEKYSKAEEARKIDNIIEMHRKPSFSNIEYISEFIDDAIICCRKVFYIDHATQGLAFINEFPTEETVDAVERLLKNLSSLFIMLMNVTDEFYRSDKVKYQDRYEFDSTLRGDDFNINHFVDDILKIVPNKKNLKEILRWIHQIMNKLHKYLVKLIRDYAKSMNRSELARKADDSRQYRNAYEGIVYCLLLMISEENEIISIMEFDEVEPYKNED